LGWSSLVELKEVAARLLLATSLPDETVFGLLDTRYTTVDYYRMACHAIFECKRCANCCTTGNPIRLRREDAARIARHFKIPVGKAIKKYTIPDGKGYSKFKAVEPCRFYDPSIKGCKIYNARPWSCRIFPFLGIYGSEDKVLVHESCPGSIEAHQALMAALEEVQREQKQKEIGRGDETDETDKKTDREDIRMAKEWFRALLEGLDR
jgi:hypothetical protein